jgi:hypothetical protein
VGVDQYLNSSGISVGAGSGGESGRYMSDIESYLLGGLEGPYRLWKSRAVRQGRTIPDLDVMLQDMVKVLSPEDVEERSCRACGDVVHDTSLRESFRSPTLGMHAS